MYNKKDDKFLIVLKDFIKSLAISLVVVIVITQFFVRPVRVDGLSMYPTLNNQEIGFSNIFKARTAKVERFDIVVVYMEGLDKNIVKRVIGMPGDTVLFRDDVLYINGEAVDEPYLDNDYVKQWKSENNGRHFTSDYGPTTVPEGEYFVVGDNRQNSTDSRRHGSMNGKNIKSMDVYVLYPFNVIRRVSN